jgi:hypothetical protein
MSINPQAGGGSTAPSITQIVTSQDRWYVNFLSGVDGDHNNHAVVAWIVTSDNKTMYPMIISPVDQKSITSANMISEDYIVLNPYSQCQACVRPPELVEESP